MNLGVGRRGVASAALSLCEIYLREGELRGLGRRLAELVWIRVCWGEGGGR